MFTCIDNNDSVFETHALDGTPTGGPGADAYAPWEWYPDRNAFHIGSRFYGMLGYDLEEGGCPPGLESHLLPEDLAALGAALSNVGKKGRGGLHLIFRASGGDGGTRWISCRGRFVEAPENGGRTRISGVFIDVTEDRKRGDTTGKSYRMLARLVDNLPGMAYRSVPSESGWRIVFVSEGVKTLLGYDPDYFLANVDHIYKDLVFGEDHPRIWNETHRAIEENRPQQMYYRMKTAAGAHKWVWEQGLVIFSDAGKPVAMEGFIADVTRQKELEIKLFKENFRLKSSLKDRYHLGNIIGKSPPMQALYERIEKAAASDANVMIYGESGTGKELVARMIHDLSPRSEKPFVTVNCGAVPENLLESEFFGYRKGAFTGAYADKKGYLAAAEGGSLFLDELGDISLNFQVKLLRIIEGHGYVPLGETEAVTPDIRIIAATNRNLVEMIGRKEMREDFFFRVHIIPITLPPLRERREDIPLLIDHFLTKLTPSGEHKLPADELSIALKGYDWPGNVRELQNTVHRYITLGHIELADGTAPHAREGATDALSARPLGEGGLRKAMEGYEKELITATLEKNRWNRDRTAKMLGIGNRTLYRKIRLYNIGKNQA